ncbi:cysteine proteinase [Annulohypoxylon maeteangense]|uniref:cysteine proteinase n=1 Tax=Annulohypoxylon maeteangense TaxID=1927788 RepID=UPI0020072563|nr:cysteine proteinase [Annulohypoxylon maeteangense]KAI0890087.1 cysteine proteinase [Annulohypoxylon maeteangense]
MTFRERLSRRLNDSVSPMRTRPHSRRLRSRRNQLSPSPSPTQPYLSYYDILLTYEDIKALKHDWLTDNNIAFWEEFLEREVLVKYPQARIVLLRPSMTFLLMKNKDTEMVRSALPDFRGITHIFLPINDAHNVSQAEGGSHWSLLVVSIIDGVAFHYDSLDGVNNKDAWDASKRLSSVLGVTLRFHCLADSPQQENGSDCGVFVCIVMRHLLIKRLLSVNAGDKVSMSMAQKAIDSIGARKEMLKIIESLRKEGERRRLTPSNTPPRIE